MAGERPLVIRNGSEKVDKWGYVVCCGIFLMFITSVGHISSFGLIYKDFIQQTHASARSLTTAHGVFYIMVAIGGTVLNILSKHISLRFGGFVGCFLLICGTLSNVFITNMDQLSITFGVLQGLGLGIMTPACYSIFNYYFFKNKRFFFMSLIKAGQGVAICICPQILKKLLMSYGFRGTLLLECGISLHTIAGILTLVKPVTTKKIIMKKIVSDGVEKDKAEGESDELLSGSVSQYGIQKQNLGKNTNKRTWRLRILDIFNYKLLEDFSFCNICIGEGFFSFSDLTFLMLQPLLMFDYGFNKTEVTNCISMVAMANVIGRCLLAVCSGFIKVNPKLLYYICTCLTFILRIVILQLRGYIGIVVISACLSVLQAILHIAGLIIICDQVSQEDLPGAYAITMLFGGALHFTLSPIIGIIKDAYNDYIPAFYGLVLCCLPCIVLWPIEYFCYRKK